MASEPTTLIYVTETVAQSWGRDIGTLLCAVILIGTGWWLRSDAMQWLGFLGTIATIWASARGHQHRLTPQQAADRLKEEFGVTAR